MCYNWESKCTFGETFMCQRKCSFYISICRIFFQKCRALSARWGFKLGCGGGVRLPVLQWKHCVVISAEISPTPVIHVTIQMWLRLQKKTCFWRKFADIDTGHLVFLLNWLYDIQNFPIMWNNTQVMIISQSRYKILRFVTDVKVQQNMFITRPKCWGDTKDWKYKL